MLPRSANPPDCAEGTVKSRLKLSDAYYGGSVLIAACQLRPQRPS